VAALVAVTGIVNLFTAVRPHAELSRLAAPIDGAALGRTHAFVIGSLLIATAWGLVAGRFAAWVGGVAVLGFALTAAIRHRPFAVLLAGTALIALIALRGNFKTRPDPVRMRLAGQIALVAIGTALIGGCWDAVANRRAPGGAGRVVIADFADASPESIRAVILMVTITSAIVAAALVALAPAAPPDPGDPEERAEVGALVTHADADSLAPFATRSDKAYVFSPDRRAAIGYRVLFGTALVGGDPVGAAASAPAAVRAFLQRCTEKGWRPAVLGASDEMRTVWHDAGLRGMRIGEEAVVDAEAFSLASRRMRNVRQAVNRTHNAGVKVTIRELSAEDAEDLRPILDEWLGGTRERGFAMNLDKILTPRPDCLIATAYSPEGEPVAFARFALAADGQVITLDVAPRGSSASNGVAERLIVEMVEYAKAHGAREVSLNFAAMRWAFDAEGLVPEATALFLRTFDRWIEIASLNRFCAKFNPNWRSRSLMMRSWSQLIWVIAAAVRAEFAPPQVRAGVPAPRPVDEPDALPDGIVTNHCD
jgi:lysyl-tRNA synthetase class 2